MTTEILVGGQPGETGADGVAAAVLRSNSTEMARNPDYTLSIRNAGSALLSACRAVLAAAESSRTLGKAAQFIEALKLCEAAVEQAERGKGRKRRERMALNDSLAYGTPMAYAYLHVSSLAPNPAAQLAPCRAYYDRHIKQQGVIWYGLTDISPDLNLTEYDPAVPLFFDLRTAGRWRPLLERPAGGALQAILKPGDHVIFSHLDQTVRSVLDHANLVEVWRTRRITVHHADADLDLSTSHGQLVANIMAAVAHAQREEMSQLRRQDCAAIPKGGLQIPWGAPPRGWKRRRGRNGQVRLVPNSELLRVYKLFCHLYEVEGRTCIDAAEIIERKVQKAARVRDWKTLPPMDLRKWSPQKLMTLYQRIRKDRAEPQKRELQKQRQAEHTHG